MADPTPEDEAEGAAKVDRLGPRASEEARRPLARRDPTPEERAAKLWSPFGSRPLIAQSIREAEAVARAKAFEEAEQALLDVAAERRAMGRRSDARYYDHAAEIVRARVKEAPRGS